MKSCLLMSWVLSLLIAVTIACETEVKPKTGSFDQLEPDDDAIVSELKPSFSWTASENATSYSLTISQKSDFSDAVVIDGITSTSFKPTTELREGTTYYWKVESRNGENATSANNSGIFFRTVSAPPSASPGISKYYVSPSGEDNPDHGTLAAPYRTLAYAVTRIPASEGDTVILMAGTFRETHPSRVPLGVSIIGMGESQTIISASGVSLDDGINPQNPEYKFWFDGSLIQLISPHRVSFRNMNSAALPPAPGNQTLSGFTIDGNNKSLKAGIWVENRNDVTLHDLTFRDVQQRGAVLAPGAKNFYVYPEYYMTGIKIYNCEFINCGKDLADESLGNLCIAQLDGAEIHHIKITDNEGYGIKFIYDGYFKNTRIYDCEIALNEKDSKWGEDIAIELWNLGPGNEIHDINCNTWLSIVNHPEIFGTTSGVLNMKVYNVNMVDIDGNSSKEAVEVAAPGVEVSDSYFENKGFGIAIWDMGRENITIRNNIFFNTVQKENWAGGPGIYIDNSRTWQFKNIRIFNNIFDTHKISIRLKNSGAGIEDVQIMNNVFINSGAHELEAAGNGILFTNNLTHKSGGAGWSITGSISESNNFVGTPLFMSTGHRRDDYYKPTASSVLIIDKGVNVGLPFNGSAPDIGRFEY